MKLRMSMMIALLMTMRIMTTKKMMKTKMMMTKKMMKNYEDKVPRGVAGVALASGVGGTAPCSGNCRGGSLRHWHVNYCDSSKLVMIMLYEISPLLLFIIFKPPEIRSWTCDCSPHWPWR